MKRQEITVDFSINGSQVAFGHQFLEDIMRYIPDIRENQAIFRLLAKSNNPEAREIISRNMNLSTKTTHLLLDDDNQEVVCNILSNSVLAKKINEDALLKIIKSDNVKYLIVIAENIESYELCNICKIAHILCNHQNALVRYGLVRYGVSCMIPTKIIRKLSKDKDMDVAKEANDALARR